MYNRDLGGTRFSPLKQVNTGNVSKLARAWSYPLGKDQTSGTLSGGSEFTPIVVDGVMYVAASNHVAALQADDGTVVWRHDVKTGAPSRRGVAYWPGEGSNPPRIIFTAGRRLIALKLNTGTLDASFGKEGEVDMVVPYNSVPFIYKNVVVV